MSLSEVWRGKYENILKRREIRLHRSMGRLAVALLYFMRGVISNMLLWVSKRAGFWALCPEPANLYITTTVHFEYEISCPDDAAMKHT
jgi:hypothetical protein